VADLDNIFKMAFSKIGIHMEAQIIRQPTTWYSTGILTTSDANMAKTTLAVSASYPELHCAAKIPILYIKGHADQQAGLTYDNKYHKIILRTYSLLAFMAESAWKPSADDRHLSDHPPDSIKKRLIKEWLIRSDVDESPGQLCLFCGRSLVRDKRHKCDRSL
jgi:hypothetical protein